MLPEEPTVKWLESLDSRASIVAPYGRRTPLGGPERSLNAR